MAGKHKGKMNAKKKRDKLKQSNPRATKRGGRKSKIRGKMKEIIQTAKDFMWELHLKYHHSKLAKKICKENKCPLRGRRI